MKKIPFKILSVIALVATILGAFGVNYAFATTVQPKTVAFFQDSLAVKMTTTDTSFTLVRGTDSQSRSLSGTYGFVLDEGTASQETVICSVSGTAATSCTRGVDIAFATTTVAANKFAHARGATVKITTWPSVGIINNQLSGVDTLPVPIRYDTTVSTSTIASDNRNLVNVALLNYMAFGGVPAASESANGFVQLATGAQAAASTLTGSTGARLVLPSSLATSTYNSATAANVIVATGGSGKIDNNFISTTTLFSSSATLGTTTINGFTTGYASTTKVLTPGVYTITRASLVGSMLRLQCWAGGGSGDSSNTSLGATAAGGGGGYIEKFLRIQDLGTTETLTVGAGGAATNGGAGNNGGNTSFGSWFTVYGGAGGVAPNNSALLGGNGGGAEAMGGVGAGIGTNTTGGNGIFWGGGAGGGNNASTGWGGGNSTWGGGGGGSANSVGAAGGVSGYGGSGGAGSISSGVAATAGAQPGGGGGSYHFNGVSANSGKGGDGECDLTSF